MRFTLSMYCECLTMGRCGCQGGSLMGLGSDIGGSIRFPANFNGVFGHKPSAGYVPTTGHFPQRAGRGSMMSVIGPICRYCTPWPRGLSIAVLVRPRQ